MLQPTEDHFRAIVNLKKSNPESFQVFVDWLSQSFSGHLLIAAQTEKDVHSRWIQGRCQELGDLLQYISSAEVQMAALKTATAESVNLAANKFD
jgi:hypothetical protein